ncbi:MAG: ABC transporter ATP-binding protein, partial [Miltoncostaeaceae bacterium]
MAFGLRAKRVGRAERRTRAAALLAEVGLDGLGRRRVGGLSGGERQRVALARALCAEPALLLMDEPLASVDPDRRESLRALIVGLQRARGITTVVVTHDRDEAAEMGERIAVMIEGRIVQCSSPEELLLAPTSPVVARFMGLRNIVSGPVREGTLACAAGSVPASGPDGDARVVVRPEGLVPDPDGTLTLEVREATLLGSALRLRLEGAGLALEARAPVGTAHPPVGERV